MTVEEMLHEVTGRLARAYGNQYAKQGYYTSERLALLFQLHTLLTLTAQGRMAWTDWPSLERYGERIARELRDDKLAAALMRVAA